MLLFSYIVSYLPMLFYRCFFAKKKCEQPSLTILYPGDCIPTTPMPSNTTDDPSVSPEGSSTTEHPDNVDLIHEVFCSNKETFKCRDELDPVCGTDYTFYQNE